MATTIKANCTHRYPYRGQGIVGRVLKFTGYTHHYKIIPGKIFGHILKKNKMVTWGHFFVSHEAVCRDFPVTPPPPPPRKRYDRRSSQICRICSSLQKLTWDYFCLILIKKNVHHRVFPHSKLWDVKLTYRKLWAGILLMWSDLT